MSVNLPNQYVEQFATTIALLLQQKGSKLRPHVMSGAHYGSQASPVDQVAPINMQQVLGPFSPMGRVDAVLDRRWVLPNDFDLPQLIDSFEKLRLLIDPSSTYVQNAVYAAGRQYDDLIINALFGNANIGQNGGTTVSFATGGAGGGGTTASVSQGAASATNLTVAKLRYARRILMQNQVDLESDPLICIVMASQHDSLLAEAQIISTDFNDRPVLVDGKVQRFLGIDIVHCERLLLNGSSYRQVPVYAKSGMYLGIWNDMKTDIAQRKDLQGLPWQAYVYMTAGASRLEEKKLVQLPCSES